jgi:hypothetical protein
MEYFGTTDFGNNSRLITLSAIIIRGLHCIWFVFKPQHTCLSRRVGVEGVRSVPPTQETPKFVVGNRLVYQTGCDYLVNTFSQSCSLHDVHKSSFKSGRKFEVCARRH